MPPASPFRLRLSRVIDPGCEQKLATAYFAHGERERPVHLHTEPGFQRLLENRGCRCGGLGSFFRRAPGARHGPLGSGSELTPRSRRRRLGRATAPLAALTRLLHKSWHVIVTRTPTFRVANASQNSPCSIRPCHDCRPIASVAYPHQRGTGTTRVYGSKTSCSAGRTLVRTGRLCNWRAYSHPVLPGSIRIGRTSTPESWYAAGMTSCR